MGVSSGEASLGTLSENGSRREFVAAAPCGVKYFFSYARADSGFVLKLAQDLRDAGVEVWLDQLDILGGQRWDRAVQDALEACDGMIAVLSPASVASHNVMDEVSYTLEKGKPVVPVLMQPCDVPFRLRRVQHVDFTAGYAAALSRLLRALGGESGASAQPAPPPRQEPGSTSDEPSPGSGSSPTAPTPSERVDPVSRSWARTVKRASLGGLVGAIWGLLLFRISGDSEGWPYAMALEALLWVILGGLIRRGTVRFAIVGAFVGALVGYFGGGFIASALSLSWRRLDGILAAGVLGVPLGAILGSIVGRWLGRLPAPSRLASSR